jgi:hypothetical protein
VQELFKTTDPDGVTVCLLDDAWDHIVQEHPEMGTMAPQEEVLGYIKQIVEKPHSRYQDADFPERRSHYTPFILPKPYNRTYLKVSIRYYRRRWPFFEKRGAVNTAYPTDKIKPGEKQI